MRVSKVLGIEYVEYGWAFSTTRLRRERGVYHKKLQGRGSPKSGDLH